MRKDFNKYNLKDLEAQIAKTESILNGRNFEKSYQFKDSPMGRNGMPTDLLFEERLFYKEGMYSQLEQRDIGMIDRWNTVLEYGKSDSSGKAIYPREYHLKQVTSTEKNIFGINFVVDVLEQMSDWAEEYLYKAGSAYSRTGSPIFPINITRGWQSATIMYNDHIGEIYKSFTNDYLSNKHSKILAFEHFVEHFIDFCKIVSVTTPITFSSFIESKFCPIHINGITFELAEDQYDDDNTKFEEFLEHPHYELFRYAAQIHGFMIDKNIPWRIYANFNHPKMIDAAKREMLLGGRASIRNIIGTAYNPADNADIFLLKFHLPAFYNSYIKFMPIVDTPFLKTCSFSGTRVENGQTFRSPIKAFNIQGKLDEQSSYFKEYSDKFWLKFYYEIKNLENGYKMPKNVRMQNVYKVLNHYDTFGFDSAVDKVNSDIRLQRGKDNLKRGFITKSAPSLVIQGELNINPDRRQASPKVNYSFAVEDINVATGEVVSSTPVSNGTGGPAGSTGGGASAGGGGGGGY